MEANTKASLLRQLPHRWERQYDKEALGIYQALVAEGESLTEMRAAEIIGNDSWTQNICDECKRDCDVTVSLGEELDYDSATASICLPCLQKAVALATPPAPAAPVTV